MTDTHENASKSRQCPSCATALPADAPAGLCPQCLLKQGLTGDSEAITQEEPATDQPIAGATWLASQTQRSGGRFVPPSPLELSAQFPQLEILELLGQGGMGAVYKARQRDLDRIIALKILPPDADDGETFAQRFSREAIALAKLNHAHIVMVHEFGRTDAGLYFFIMEYVDGLNLRQLLHDHKLTPAEALAIVPQICDALQFAHEEGVVHRDIKPENILIDKKGRVKIADFGLAKLMSTSPEDITLTRDGGMMGTPQYMAPEQLECAKYVDHRADIYSLGVVFYELLTGELPLGRFDPPSQRVQIDVRLDEIVMRTLEKEPDRRYQHASELKTKVETIGDLTPQQFESIKQAMGREYKSKATLFGIPLVHVATGIDPKTGKKRVAKGIIALGDVAVGVFAAGGTAFGGVTFGGMSFGLLSLGGLAVGLLAAIGGLAVGGFAFGGVAIGGVAVGGVAVGYYAFGGGAWGQYVASGGHANPQAKAFFEGWAGHWPKWLAAIGVAVPIGCIMVGTLIWIAQRSGSSVSGWDNDLNTDHGAGAKSQSVGADDAAMHGHRWGHRRGHHRWLMCLVWTAMVIGLAMATLQTHRDLAPRASYILDTMAKTITPKSGAYRHIAIETRGETKVYGSNHPDLIRRDWLYLKLRPLASSPIHNDVSLRVRLVGMSYWIEDDTDERWTLDEDAIADWMQRGGVEVTQPTVREEIKGLVDFAHACRSETTLNAIDQELFSIETSGTIANRTESFKRIERTHWLVAGIVWLVGCVMVFAGRRRSRYRLVQTEEK